MLLKRLSFLEEPDLICVSSGMTYWYPGVFKLIEITKESLKKPLLFWVEFMQPSVMNMQKGTQVRILSLMEKGS